MLNEAILLRVRSGDLGFDEFARRSSAYWWAAASCLRRRWVVPEGVEIEDVVQELLLGAWVAVGRWDPSRGVAMTRYVAWNAIACAADWLHRQRDAYRRHGTSMSRHPVCESSLRHEGEERVVLELVVDAEQHTLLEARELGELALDRVDGDEREVVASALALRNLDGVAQSYYADPDFRRRRRWGCEAEARRFVRASLVKAAGEESMRWAS